MNARTMAALLAMAFAASTLAQQQSYGRNSTQFERDRLRAEREYHRAERERERERDSRGYRRDEYRGETKTVQPQPRSSGNDVRSGRDQHRGESPRPAR